MKTRRSLETFRLQLVSTATLTVIAFACVAAVLTFVPLFAYFDSMELGSDSSAEIAAYLIRIHESCWPVIWGAVIASITSGMVLFQRMRSPLARFASVYHQLARIQDALRGLDAYELEPKAATAVAEIRDSLTPLRQSITQAA